MINLTKRNIRIFFRQRAAVLFSLLAVFIVIALYVLFLGDVMLSGLDDFSGAQQLLDGWIVAGIVSVASITTTMGAAGIVVEDHARKYSKDFYAAPLKRWHIVGGYVCNIFVTGMLMSMLAWIVGQVYIVANGGAWLDVSGMLRVLGILCVSVMMSSTLVFFIASCLKDTSAFAAMSTLTGTLSGFLTGIYIPIGSLPEAVQWIIKLFPVSHASAMLRQVMLEQPMADSFAGVPEVYLTEFKEMLGVTYTFGDYTMTPAAHLAAMGIVAAVFFLLALRNIAKKES